MASGPRWGIVAAGKICHDFVSCLHLNKSRITCVGARSLESAQKFANEHRIAKAHGSYEAVFSDPDVDVVYIGTVHTKHKELTIAALKAGKHVLCEKPIGINCAQVEEMQREAKAAGKFLQEGTWTRFMPLVRRLRSIIQAGDIGDVRFVQGDFGVQFPEDNTRVWSLDTAGGALLDLGCYPITYLSWAIGPAQPEFQATSGKLDEKTGVDVFGNIALRYQGDVSAVVSWSGLCTTPEELVVSGTKGYLKILGPAHVPQKAIVAKKKDRLFEEEVIEYKWPENPEGTWFNFPGSIQFVHEIVACEEAITAGKPYCDDYTWEESVITAKIMDKARQDLGLKYPME